LREVERRRRIAEAIFLEYGNESAEMVGGKRYHRIE